MNYPARTVYRDETVASQYEARRFKGLSGRFIGNLEVRRMLGGLKRLGVDRDAVVLDVPAGTGRLTASAIEEGYRTIAVDMSSAMLRQGWALHDLGTVDGFVGASAGDIENLPLASQSVDAVMSLRLMGHLPLESKERAIREMLRVARVGAIVMFSRRTLLLRLKRAVLWGLGLRPRAQSWFDETDQEVRQLIERAGGEIVGYEDLLPPLAESRAYRIRALSTSAGRRGVSH